MDKTLVLVYKYGQITLFLPKKIHLYEEISKGSLLTRGHFDFLVDLCMLK